MIIMKRIKPIAIAAAFATSFLLSARSVSAQDAPPPPPPDAPSAESAPSPQGQQGQQGDRREQFRQRMNEHLKTALKVNDEEWGVIQPLLEKVQTKMRESMMSRFGMMGGRRGGQGGGQGGPGANANAGGNNSGDRSNRPDRPKAPEMEALQKALESDSTSPGELKTKLQAVRDARKKSTAELEQAQEDLRKVLTQRQEATLVMMGMLQ